MRRLALALAAIFLLRADMYPDASNAKLPEAQQNLGQMASITPQMYGAKGDGTTDDTVAVQNWLNDLKTGAHIGYCQGKFRLTASVNAFPTKGYRVVGAGQDAAGCNFHIDYNSDWAGNAIDLTNPVTPTTRGSAADWSSLQITYNPALTKPPRAIGGDYISDALLRDIKISQYTAARGQCMSWRQPWNIRQFTNISIWGCGGHASNHLVPAGTTFSIAAASTTLTSSVSFFTAADVGRYITCQGSPYYEAWKITGFTDATTVTVNRPASAAHTANLCGINGITGSMTAGSPTLTISAASLTASDVGRVVYIPMAGAITAGSTRTALRTTITAVSGTGVTLADSAAGTVTGLPVILSPAIEIYDANDVVLSELNLEQNAGTMLVLANSVNVRMTNSKLHAYGNTTMGQSNLSETDFNAAIFTSYPTIEGIDIEATPVGGLGRVLISGIVGGLAIGSVTGVMTTGLPHYALLGNASTSGFSFGPITGASRVDPAWLAGGVANLVYNDGTSLGALTLGPVTSYNSGAAMPKYIRSLTATVAALPACDAASKYTTASVSDQLGVPTYRGVLTGGGAIAVLAYCNGTSWEAH